ncbi:Ulp1 protease family, C-terminal catalytic domain [Phytophthora cactorum]|nr:Ulp1 protease family, C-terminal catalytic domain [Phytophthora cactorum]
MPLNINSSHWACLVLDSARKTIYCYNSMDKRSHHNLLESPLQNDGYNCGLFVCLFFWRRLVNEVGSDYSESGWMRRRWNILRMIVQATMDKDSKDQSN